MSSLYRSAQKIYEELTLDLRNPVVCCLIIWWLQLIILPSLIRVLSLPVKPS